MKIALQLLFSNIMSGILFAALILKKIKLKQSKEVFSYKFKWLFLVKNPKAVDRTVDKKLKVPPISSNSSIVCICTRKFIQEGGFWNLLMSNIRYFLYLISSASFWYLSSTQLATTWNTFTMTVKNSLEIEHGN